MPLYQSQQYRGRNHEAIIGDARSQDSHRPRIALFICWLLFLGWPLLFCQLANAQMDQGTIIGTVEDTGGAVIQGAKVILTNSDTGFALSAVTDSGGTYAFPLIKIGNYQVSATAPGFAKTTHNNIRLDVQARINIILKLRVGTVTQTVTINSAPPLLQTQDGSVGQVMSTRVIDNTPLNGRNWVYIEQLSAGVAPSNGSRGNAGGDFEANGQRAEQNKFILDGVDNNTVLAAFLNKASYTVQPPRRSRRIQNSN